MPYLWWQIGEPHARNGLTKFRARRHASSVGTIPPLPRHRVDRSGFLKRAMFRTILPVLSVLVCPLFPAPAPAQCNEQLCRNLEAILDEAVTDFRGYRANKTSAPDVSIEGMTVPCQMSLWANNVPMYICYAEVPNPDSQKWYA